MSTPPVPIEPMRTEDLDEVLVIERASFTNPWSRHAFLYELRENRVANLWVARAEGGGGSGSDADGGSGPALRGRVLGYMCVWLIADELHITNLAVHPACRRQGLARHLLGTLLEHYRSRGAARAGLEVRPSNAEARALYEAFGFRQVGLRKGYYFDTGEDALLLEVDLGRSPVPGPGPARNPFAG